MEARGPTSDLWLCTVCYGVWWEAAHGAVYPIGKLPPDQLFAPWDRVGGWMLQSGRLVIP